MNGFPAEIILGDFEIPNIENSKLLDNYTKKKSKQMFLGISSEVVFNSNTFRWFAYKPNNGCKHVK